MSGGSRQGRKSAARRLGHRAACTAGQPRSRRAGGASGEQRGGDTQAGRAWGRRVAHVSMAVMFRALFSPDVRLTRFETSIPATLRPSSAVGGQ